MNSYPSSKNYSTYLRKIVLLSIFIALLINRAKAQSNVTGAINGRVIVTDDRLPEYPGGADAFYNFITTNIRYPEQALKDSLRGIEFLSFMVEKDGQLTGIRITRGINPKLDKEVERIVKKSPKWRPAIENHVAVRQLFSFPVYFPVGNATPWIQDGADTSKIYSEVEQSAEFPGGADYLRNFVQKNVYYPQSALENNIHGKVVVTFIVEKDGSLSNVKILRGIGNGCDAEVIRAFLASPKWIPGKKNGMTVRQEYNVSLAFILQ